MNKTIASLALLKARYDETNSDIVDAFVQFVSYVIEKDLKAEFTSHQVKSCLERTFYFVIPIHSVELILNRMKKSKMIERIDKKQSIYRKDIKLVDIKTFDTFRNVMLNDYESLVSNFTDYVVNYLQRKISIEDSGKYIENYMDNYAIECIEAYSNGTSVKVRKESQDVWKFYVSSYVYYISSNDPAQFAYFASALKGRMIMNCVVARDLSDVAMRFNKTMLYLDAPIILKLLGLLGQLEEEYAKEALSLYRDCGALVKVFRHTLEEVDGILISAESNLSSPRSGYGDVIKILREKGLAPSDVALIRAKKEEALLGMGIATEPTPAYIQKYQIDETLLEKTMEEVGLRYRHDAAKRADIQSIRSSYVIRGDDNPGRLEDCKTIFVTNNSSLSRAAFEFMKKNKEYQSVSPIITDFSLTNIMWLKSSLKHSEIPDKLLAANCFAALNPSEAVWAKFYGEINKLNKNKRLSKEDHAFLRYDLKVSPELMNLTHGSDDNVTEELIFKILTNRENQIVKPYEEKIVKYMSDVQQRDRVIEEQTKTLDMQRSRIILTGFIVEQSVKTFFLVIFLCFFLFLTFDEDEIQLIRLIKKDYIAFYQGFMCIGFVLSFFSFIGQSNMNPVNYVSRKVKKFTMSLLESIFFPMS